MRCGLVFSGLLLLAIIFGIYAQGMAYFLNENLWTLSPIYYLNVLTISSVVLFITAFIYVSKGFKPAVEPKNRIVLYCIIVVFGVPTTLWSIFVFAMWQG